MKGFEMVESRESRVESQNGSFPRSAWERDRATLCVALAPRSGEDLRSHAERGNEAHEAAPCPVPPAPRRGISLTEVLISLGILTLGLLGAAALFPVGGWYMQKATIADNGHAIAQAVMSDIIARGTINPKAWIVMTPTPPITNPAQRNVWNYVDPSVDGKYTSPPSMRAGTFTRPFAEALATSLKANVDPTTLSRQFGDAYVIDPLFVAHAAVHPPQVGSAANNVAVYPFPASAIRAFPRDGWAYYNTAQWAPWEASGANAEKIWPIRRVTLQDSSGWPMRSDMASYYFRGSDDLTSDLPSRADRPARQNWNLANLDGTGLIDPLNRQRVGDYSWIVTLSPTTPDARNGLARSPESFAYDVSVVVFHKRVLPTESAATAGINNTAAMERAVSAKVISTGLNGGELLLQALVNSSGAALDALPADPFTELKTGNWMLLCGPHPTSTAASPKFVVKWYQILTIENELSSLITRPKYQRLVSVRGPQWPWLPADSLTYNTLSNDLCAGIFRGAVAVHTTTMRLENPRGDGMALVSPVTGKTSGNAPY